MHQATSARLREIWEEGVEDASCRTQLLSHLNSKLTGRVRCICSASGRFFGKDAKQCDVQINVNKLEYC